MHGGAPVVSERGLAEVQRRVFRYALQAGEAASQAVVSCERSSTTLALLAAAVDDLVSRPLDRPAIERALEYMQKLKEHAGALDERLEHIGRIGEVARLQLVQAEAQAAELRVLAEAQQREALPQ
jgi:hypothetical protein